MKYKNLALKYLIKNTHIKTGRGSEAVLEFASFLDAREKLPKYKTLEELEMDEIISRL